MERREGEKEREERKGGRKRWYRGEGVADYKVITPVCLIT